METKHEPLDQGAVPLVPVGENPLDAPVWSRICAEDVLRSLVRDMLMSWLQPAISSLETVGVKLSKESGVEPDFAGLARGLAELMQADGGTAPLPLPIRESLWVIGGLCDPSIMPKVLNSLGGVGTRLRFNGKPQPADAAVRLWLKDRKLAIHIYKRHHDDNPDYRPIDEERLEEEGRDAAAKVLRLGPNRAFLDWQDILGKLLLCQNKADTVKLQGGGDTLREWFETLGHWRDLKPNAKDLDPDDHNAHAKHQKQIEDFIAARKAGLRAIEYDEVKPAHKCQHEGTKHEKVEYNWEFFRDGISQVIVRTAGGNVLPPHRDPLKRQYFKNTPPSGYAILESGEKLEGTVFFPNGDSYGFDPCFGDENRFYPEELFRAGDYELRKVGKQAVTLEAFHAVAQGIKQNTDLIPDMMQKQEAIPVRTAAMLRGTIKQRLGTLGTVVEEDFTASPHFTNLTWRGNQYVLRQTAAVIIETLYIAQKHYGIPGFHQEEVFAQVYGSNKKGWPSGKTRIQNFFRTGDAKRLWNDGLIDHDSKGNFRLNLKIHTHTQ